MEIKNKFFFQEITKIPWSFINFEVSFLSLILYFRDIEENQIDKND